MKIGKLLILVNLVPTSNSVFRVPCIRFWHSYISVLKWGYEDNRIWFFLGQGILIIAVGLIVRSIVSFLASFGNKFRWLTMVFIAVSWIPKATVQVRRLLHFAIETHSSVCTVGCYWATCTGICNRKEKWFWNTAWSAGRTVCSSMTCSGCWSFTKLIKHLWCLLCTKEQR